MLEQDLGDLVAFGQGTVHEVNSVSRGQNGLGFQFWGLIPRKNQEVLEHDGKRC
jgi:predicted 2-oxoglutarate/Fe(II)-dependent dioxygenase YbiX